MSSIPSSDASKSSAKLLNGYYAVDQNKEGRWIVAYAGNQTFCLCRSHDEAVMLANSLNADRAKEAVPKP